MILSDIKKYLQSHGSVALADIAIHFDAEPDAVRGMLEVWERKGMVEKNFVSASCGDNCKQCDITAVEIYHWLGSDAGKQTITCNLNSPLLTRKTF